MEVEPKATSAAGAVSSREQAPAQGGGRGARSGAQPDPHHPVADRPRGADRRRQGRNSGRCTGVPRE
eukprot:6281102-Lingulodinium_polyedra.AAC.1